MFESKAKKNQFETPKKNVHFECANLQVEVPMVLMYTYNYIPISR